jgi:hypothetical protein
VSRNERGIVNVDQRAWNPRSRGAEREDRAPQFDFSNGQLVVPHPPTSREEIQEPFVREQQIDPKKYYPKGYHAEGPAVPV